MTPDGDAFLLALDNLEQTLDDNTARIKLMKKRITTIRRERANGKTWRQIVEAEDAPLIVQLLRENTQGLNDAGSRVRRTEALALHDEGMTMDQIAEKFGVTRQRVSGLLRGARDDAG